MWIMIAGPYRTGSKDPKQWERNLEAMNLVAYEVFCKGHTPIIGVNLALPIVNVIGENSYDKIMMPISLAAAQKCDAILRIGGTSKGADQEVEIFKKRGLRVYYNLEEIPLCKVS